ncbi:MAG: beta strand repeat-containing protein [Pseudomarimonas sp.]
MKLAKLVAGTLLAIATFAVKADTTPFDLSAGNLFQDWSDAGLITVDDNWTGVPSIIGQRGDNLTAATGVDPQTVVAADDPGVLDVNANQTLPNTFATGGASEFAIADPTIALAGSGTADAPYLRIHLDTTGRRNVFVNYRLRDLESGADNAVQAVALQYRLGSSGAWTNLPAAFVADATAGPNLAGPDSLVAGLLPEAADNQPEVQVRIITTNAGGNDEWVGIDDLSVTSQAIVPVLSVANLSQNEGNMGITNFVFTASLDALAVGNCDFSIETLGGTATAGVDYVASTQNLSIADGTMSTTFTIQVNGDTDIETDETFNVETFGEPQNCDIAGTADAVGTIVNDDSANIDVSTTAASVAEGNGGTVNLSLPVSLSAAAPAQVSIPFTVTAGTATAGVDYQTTSGNVVIAMGAMAGSAIVVVNGDLLDENNETLIVTLGAAPQGFTITNGSALGTINDDDLPPTISVSSPSVLEGNAGTSPMTFMVSLSAPSGLDVGFTRATANGTATAGVDYVALAAAAGTITAGNTTVNVVVQVNGDTDVEPNESFNLNLTGVSNASPATTSGTGTITNDDANIVVGIAPASVTEGSGGTVNLALPVSLSAPALAELTVPFVVTAGSATSTVDYQTANGNVVIAGGSNAGSAVVVVSSDLLDENDETLTVTLGSVPANYVLGTASAVGTILDDDAAPALSVSSPTAIEGNSGTAPLTFVVSLSAPSSFDVTFDRQTSDGSATAGSDYVALASAAATIVAGQTSTNVVVQINGDFSVEANETVNLNLTGITNASPASVSAVGTISNDDSPSPPVLVIPTNDIRGLGLLVLLMGLVSVVVLRRRG